MSITNKIICYLDSSNRLPTSIDTDNWNININIPNEYSSSKNGLNMVSCVAATIPKTYYQISTGGSGPLGAIGSLGYNTLILIENGVSTLVTLPVGNYTYDGAAPNYLSILESALFQASPNVIVYTVTYSTITGILKILANDIAIPISINFITPSNLYEIYGFLPNTNYPFAIVGITQVLNSPFVINANAQDSLYICSDICQNYNTNYYSSTALSGNNNILTSMDMSSTNQFSTNFTSFDMKDNLKPFSGCKTYYNFFITNEQGNHINLNGVNMKVVLCIFRYDPVAPLFRELIDYNKEKKEKNEKKMLTHQPTNPNIARF